MKITVINLKKIIKYIFIFFIIIFSLLIISNSIKNQGDKESEPRKISLIRCLKYELPITKVEEPKDIISKEGKITTKILSMQIGILENVIQKESEEEYIDTIEDEDLEENLEEIIINEEININNEKINEIKVIEENNIKETYTNKYQDIEINNQTSYDINQILENASYTVTNKKKVIIYHTHTCESYTPTENFNYTMTDSYRTTDLNFTVSKVGDELGVQLEKFGIEVIHSKNYHDYPSYNGSYGRSLKTLESILSTNNDTEIVIDLHRDAVGSKSNYAPSVQIGDEVCAQVMFVIGTDGSGLSHNKWRENLQYAIKVQHIADTLYPGLFRPIILRNARYNQHLTTASTIIEVGATGNTLEQCLASMKYVAEILYKATE